MVATIINTDAVGTTMHEIIKSGLILRPFQYMPIGTANRSTPRNLKEIYPALS